MTPRQRGVTLAALQVLLVLGVIARLAWDRMTLPRVWARTLPVDPSDPLRGRYVSLRLEAEDRRPGGDVDGIYAVEANRLVLRGRDRDLERGPDVSTSSDTVRTVQSEPVAFFIPENIPDPSRLGPGQELWVEVTVPADGLPRPIRLEVRDRSAAVPTHR